MTLSARCLRTGHFRDLTIEQTARQELGVRKRTHDLLPLLLKQNCRISKLTDGSRFACSNIKQ